MLLVGKIFLVFLIALATLLTAFGITWVWVSRENIRNRISPARGLAFDYIIIGAGTAGSVVTHELGLNSNYSILLIEAGDLFSPLSKVPLLATVLQRSKYDWQFKSVPQKYSSFGLTKQMQSHPRGKGLGGSAQINYMLHFGGESKDFETWNQMGIKGWSLRSASSPSYSYGQQSFAHSMAQCSSQHHQPNFDKDLCLSMPLRNETAKSLEIWTVPKNYSAITEAFVEAGSLLNREGLQFRLAKYTIKNGIRWSVFEKFLRPIFTQDNIKILSNTIAKRIQIDQGQARSVIVENPDNANQKFEIQARREIILSAGAFQSPQLLQVSGVGPKHLLDSIGVKQVHSSKNVGQNLHDHFHLPLFVSIDVPASITVSKILSLSEIVKYLLTGQGLFGNFGVVGSVTSVNDTFSVTLFATGAIDEQALMDVSNFRREDFRFLFPLYHNASQEGFVILSSCLQPTSRGTVKAASSNVEEPPLVDPRYLQSQHDVSCMLRAVRAAVRLIATPPFRAIGSKIHWPRIQACSKFGPLNRDFYTNQPSDKYLECLMRRVALTGHHPGGTCSMGIGPNSAVDSKMRLRGIDRLRVIDASILPTPISGTPNSVLVSMAKRAAKLILKDVS